MPAAAEITGQAVARARFVRMSATKARRVVDLVRGLPTQEADAILRFAPQAASEPVRKVLLSAVANAEHNNELDANALFVSEAFVDEGPTYKRIQPRAMGRAFAIRKRTCHITIVVSQRAAATATTAPRASRGQSKGRTR